MIITNSFTVNSKSTRAHAEHIIKALHNTFNNIFVKVKREWKFIPSGIKLSLLDHIEEGLVAQVRKHDRDDDYNNFNKRGNRNRNNNGNQTNGNRNNDNYNNNNHRDNRNGNVQNKTNQFQTNWIYTGVFRDNFNPYSIRSFRTKVPSYNNKTICLKRGIKGFCHPDCKMYHGPVSKTDTNILQVRLRQ